MKLAVIREREANENRVAVTPETVKDFVSLGASVIIESKAGDASGISDDEYKDAGAKISNKIDSILDSADVLLKVQPPTAAQVGKLKNGAILIGMLSSSDNKAMVKKYISKKISAFSMEFVPRISRAQNMDVLSSQSNLSGYKAVIDAVAEFGKVVPMMMTAAGTIRPAKILIIGAGVAGLQAIATAKRLGAIVSAFDVRSVAKEQVESLGATFVEVDNSEGENAETKGGYAKEMSAVYKKRQAELIQKTAKDQDIIICTALIPGRPAPTLITDKIVKDMRSGSVIVDLAVASGGNCVGSKLDQIVMKHGVKIIGYSNMAARLAFNASRLYAKNLFNFLQPMMNKKLKRVKIDFEDEIVQGCLLTYEGRSVHPSLKKEKVKDKVK